MKKVIIHLIIVSLFILSLSFYGESLQASVNVTPSSLHIPMGQSSSQNVQYQFTGNTTINISLNSPNGSFMVGNDTIETNPSPLTITVKNGAGTVSETILIPVKVIERALKIGSNSFTYRRNFSGMAIGPFITIIQFTITTEAGASFAINRIGLYFENKRPDITVERNLQNLKAYADIRFAGSGLMQGYWEVDGRILSQVNQHLTSGGSITLQTPEIPSLPTFDTGTHIVKFIVKNPSIGIPPPSILYFVIPEGVTCSVVSIKPLAPAEGVEVAYSPLKFEWEKAGDATLFLIGFYDNPDSKPIFSAYTKDTAYMLPESVLKSIFLPGNKYYWKIMGFDAKNNVICENKFQEFSFKKQDELSPGRF